MKFFCINLPGAEERRLHAEGEFDREGIDAAFVRGIDAKASRLSHAMRWITPGHIGCALSHTMLAEMIRLSGEVTVVMEDDAMLVPGFSALLPARLATLPEDWDVAMIGWHPDRDDYGAIATTVTNDDWMRLRSGDVWGTYAYVVSGTRGAEKLLSCISPITTHIDRMFNESAIAGKLNSYFLREQLVWWRRDFASQTA